MYAGRPLMVEVEFEDGAVFYTSFHNRAQVSAQEKVLLQLLVLKQISTSSNTTVAQASQSLGISLTALKRAPPTADARESEPPCAGFSAAKRAEGPRAMPCGGWSVRGNAPRPGRGSPCASAREPVAPQRRLGGAAFPRWSGGRRRATCRGGPGLFCVDITCSTSYTVVMAKRNLTIQLDEATIRHAKIVAAHRGLSLSSLVAQQLNELAEADQRYERARAVALGALADATGGAAPSWHREELYDR